MSHESSDSDCIGVRAHNCDLVTFGTENKVLDGRILDGSEETVKMSCSICHIIYPLDALDGESLAVEYS